MINPIYFLLIFVVFLLRAIIILKITAINTVKINLTKVMPNKGNPTGPYDNFSFGRSISKIRSIKKNNEKIIDAHKPLDKISFFQKNAMMIQRIGIKKRGTIIGSFAKTKKSIIIKILSLPLILSLYS
ncbi:MAG: hypothetical protein JXB50_15815 [Spirochaetes bacterium]|nr:hypothetical protein [Spirochaetota bacterium]